MRRASVPRYEAVVTATVVTVAALQFPSQAEWTATWHDNLDLGASLWLVMFVALWPALRMGQGAWEWVRGARGARGAQPGNSAGLEACGQRD